MKITAVRALPIDITPQPKTQPRVPMVAPGARFANPLQRYPEYARDQGRYVGSARWRRTACVVTAEDGTWGFGITLFGEATCRIINDHLGPALVGQNAMAIEKCWDMINLMAAQYGRTGMASYAISALDVALWDLKGKLLGRPVYELLGGPQKERITCYGSNTSLAYGLEPALEWCMELGFKATKVFLTEGDETGLAGINRSVEMVARAREIVGDDVELALDCWLSMDREHTVRLVERLRPYNLKWVEDPLLPEDEEGYVKLRQRLPWQTLATGEHWYTPHPFARAASQGLVDILQPDVLWCGGITAAVRICHLAEAFGLSVIPHASMNYPYGQHLAFAMPAVPWGERSEGVSPPGVPLEEMVALPGTPVIVDGYLVPSDAPGFGLEIDDAWLEWAASR